METETPEPEPGYTDEAEQRAYERAADEETAAGDEDAGPASPPDEEPSQDA